MLRKEEVLTTLTLGSLALTLTSPHPRALALNITLTAFIHLLPPLRRQTSCPCGKAHAS